MVKWGLVLILLLGLLPSLAMAQDDTGKTATLAGTYSLVETIDGQTLKGTVTIAGSGPIYSLTIKGGPNNASTTITGLAQGNIMISLSDGTDCAPAALLRQTDGTMFGVYIDSSTVLTSLGVEHYLPHKPTTGFAGVYDYVGSYADGSQYTGTATIVKNKNSVYDLTYSFDKDENYPGETSAFFGTLIGTGLSNGKILGFSFSGGDGKSCGVFVASFAVDGSYRGDFVTSDGRTGTVSGQKSG